MVVIPRRTAPRFVLYVMVGYLTVATVDVLIKVATLVITPEIGHQSRTDLVLDLGSVFGSITLIFSLWYQLADTHVPGGARLPPERRPARRPATVVRPLLRGLLHQHHVRPHARPGCTVAPSRPS